MDKQFVKQYYDDHVKAKLRNYILGSPRVDTAYNALLEFIPKEVESILEIGCGIGHIPDRLARQFPDAQVIGFDISEKSVQCARSLFTSPNLNFVQADRITEVSVPGIQLYDVMIMMDVYEHIPLEERLGLHQFIKEKLSNNGILFLSCPMPAFLAWLKENEPDKIQPVDEDIDLQTLYTLGSETGLRLVNYTEKNIWYNGDYFYAVFNKKPFYYGKKSGQSNHLSVSVGTIIRRTVKGKWNKIALGKAERERNARRDHVSRVTGIKL